MLIQLFQQIREYIAKVKLSKNKSIHANSSAKVIFHRLYLKERCSLNIGADSIVEGIIFFEKPDAAVSIGERTFVGDSRIFAAKEILIGNDVLISWGCHLVDHNSHSLKFNERSSDVVNWRQGIKDWSKVKSAPIVIKDKAWVGFNSIILKGVTVGEGAIIGAGSVVTKDVPPYTVVAGNPARVIRELSDHER